MQWWSRLRFLVFSLVFVGPILLQSGCGGDGAEPAADGGAATDENDPTLDPANDPTMQDNSAE